MIEKRFNPILSMDREAFVAALSDVPPKASEMMAILRERAPRRESGAHLVDHGDHEDRSGGAEAPRSSHGRERIRRLLRRRRVCARHELDRFRVWAPPAAFLPRRGLRRDRASPLGAV